MRQPGYLNSRPYGFPLLHLYRIGFSICLCPMLSSTKYPPRTVINIKNQIQNTDLLLFSRYFWTFGKRKYKIFSWTGRNVLKFKHLKKTWVSNFYKKPYFYLNLLFLYEIQKMFIFSCRRSEIQPFRYLFANEAKTIPWYDNCFLSKPWIHLVFTVIQESCKIVILSLVTNLVGKGYAFP